MNSDIRVSTTFRNNRKRKRLARQLGDKAVVCLLDLWIGAALSRPEGSLVGWDEQDIADEAGWEGEPAVFVNALLEIGFLDRLPDSSFAIHNWEKHNPWAAGFGHRSRLAKKAAALRWGYDLKEEAPVGQAAPKGRKAPARRAEMPQDDSTPAPKAPHFRQGRFSPPAAAAPRKAKPQPDSAPASPQQAAPLPPAPVSAPDKKSPPGPPAPVALPAGGHFHGVGPDAAQPQTRQDHIAGQPDACRGGIGQDFPGQEDSPVHPHNNGEQAVPSCAWHGACNANSCKVHDSGNAESCQAHSSGNSPLCGAHTIRNAPSPSPDPYPYPSPSPSPGPSPSPSPGAGGPPAASGSVRSRASPKKRQTDDKASSIKIHPCPHEEILELYHRLLPANPRVESWTARNRADLALAWQADPARQSLEWWQDFFLRVVAQNRFLSGKKNNFAASLGWLIKPKVLGRILAGSYNDFTPNRDQGPALWFLEQTHERSGQDGLCQGNGSSLKDVRPGGAARQDEDRHLF
ncbi:MAG: hypothetical protein QMD09_13800 [Desulfatibacillaceae bacterium]|nr:hypothetical protein [Desulfatibacillaceae bacterium]